MGIEVIAVERHPVIAALLRDACDRLNDGAAFRRHGLAVPQVVEAESVEFLRRLPTSVDCIYLDPMFPPKRKASALAARPLRLLRELTGDDDDAAELFAAATAAAARRVVVKRPQHAPPLAAAPDEAFEGKLVRYDVYLQRH